MSSFTEYSNTQLTLEVIMITRWSRTNNYMVPHLSLFFQRLYSTTTVINESKLYKKR